MNRGVCIRPNVAAVVGAWVALVAGGPAFSATGPAPAPPSPAREFRGAWVATVGNIDWPSKPGLPVAEQKAELLAILDHAAALRLNAVLFQVRPACDALYASKIEPWSEFLTGTMGRAPEPFYDPLAFAVTEAHRRGLELHAWFNPYRARIKSDASPVAAGHVSRRRPHLVRDYGKYLWLDPGQIETQEYSLGVVLDVVRRYAVDGVHFDDYFYPYPERGPDGRTLEFPDEASWQQYGVKSGLSREDWRRDNVNRFIQRVHQALRAEQRTVKFGVSPFGIWRPGYPAQIKGFDAYASLYADARRWLEGGWVDYFAPQLYWAIGAKEQSFTALLDWWNQHNPLRRHIWPGLNSTRARTWGAQEIVDQIRLAGRQPVSAGHIHWNMKSLRQNAALTAALAHGPYAQQALVPACPWLDATAPRQPVLSVSGGHGAGWQLSWKAASGERPRLWVLQVLRAGQWTNQVLTTDALRLEAPGPEAVALRAVDAAGNLSAPATALLKR